MSCSHQLTNSLSLSLPPPPQVQQNSSGMDT